MTDNELVPVVQQLLDIEAIKKLKATYFRFIDTKAWDALRGVFTDDCRHYYVDEDGVENFTSNDDYLPMLRSTIEMGVTTHHGHMPEITITGPSEAEGIWAMFDYVQTDGANGRNSLMGYGHYFETYRKESDGRWRISSKRNVRLRVDQVPWTLPS